MGDFKLLLPSLVNRQTSVRSLSRFFQAWWNWNSELKIWHIHKHTPPTQFSHPTKHSSGIPTATRPSTSRWRYTNPRQVTRCLFDEDFDESIWFWSPIWNKTISRLDLNCIYLKIKLLENNCYWQELALESCWIRFRKLNPLIESRTLFVCRVTT